MIAYTMLPEHMREAARKYIEDHELPGDFLTAVLCNNLVDAFGKADATNTAAMRTWASWLWNECPADAWGSRAKVAAWTKDPA